MIVGEAKGSLLCLGEILEVDSEKILMAKDDIQGQ